MMIRHKALVVDYDGTIAHKSKVPESTVEALLKAKRSGRKLILCTGRQIRYLVPDFSRLEIFDIIVAENGGTLYFPDTKEEILLAEAPNAEFVAALKKRGIPNLELGKTIVATWEPYDRIVHEEIRNHGLELNVIYNKGAVMVLPAGVTKATGLACALKELELSMHNIAGVGDAENDHAFLKFCETSCAVANALPALKENVDHVLDRDHGSGVEDLIAQMLEDDLRNWRTARHDIKIGRDARGQAVQIAADGGNILVIGASGSGKSTFTSNFLQRLTEQKYQVVVIDPEGDYERFEKLLTLGDGKIPPSEEQAIEALRDPKRSVITNLLAVKMDKRPHFLQRFYPKIEELRTKSGRPHWVILDEAHHMLEDGSGNELAQANSVLYITIHPNRLPKSILSSISLVVSVGAKGEDALRELLPALGRNDEVKDALKSGEALILDLTRGLQKITLESPGRYHSRHRRKYAEGSVGDERSFVFRGPENKLKLKAGNLQLFLQIAEGVDDDTWVHHLRRHDYSRWFEAEVKDADLAKDTAAVESDGTLDAQASRLRVREIVEKYYVVPRV